MVQHMLLFPAPILKGLSAVAGRICPPVESTAPSNQPCFALFILSRFLTGGTKAQKFEIPYPAESHGD